MRSMIFACGAAVLAAGAARAGDHPHTGVWGEASVRALKENPEFFGADGCFNSFTEQRADGRFRYYIVNHARWVDEQEIEYVLAQEGTCTPSANGKTETCHGGVIGERAMTWYITYDGGDAGSTRVTYYENVFYFEKRVQGEALVRQACPFDMARMKPYISGRTVADCATRCRAFGASEAGALAALVASVKGQK